VVLVSQGEPWQAAPRPESPYYDRSMAKQYTEYDVKQANEYLDKAGYSQKDGEGFRLGQDGKRINFTVEVAAGGNTAGARWVDLMELIKKYWRAVGIDINVKSEDRSIFYTRKRNNQPDATVWSGDGGLYFDIVLDPRWYVPMSEESNYAMTWAQWYLGDPLGQEPPPVVKDQIALYRKALATPDRKERDRLMKQILAIAKEQFYVIGISLSPLGFGIVKNNFHNVPSKMPGAYQYPDPAPVNPEQFYIKE
jgi:ABC-type transport system substrate-binding protein